MTKSYISCYNDKRELEHFEVPEPVYVYIIQLENEIKYGSGGGYGSECWAQQRVFEHYDKTLKDKVEYLAPDSSKTVSKPPIDPPRVL